MTRRAALSLAVAVALAPSARAAALELAWTSGGLHFSVDQKDLRVTRGEEEVFSARKVATGDVAGCAKYAREGIQAAVEEAPEEQRRRLDGISGYSCSSHVEPLSVVGHWVSYSYGSEGFTGGAHPYDNRSFEARDLDRPAAKPGEGEPASLLDLFAEEDVVEALAHDPFISERLPKGKHFDGIEELIQAVGSDCQFFLNRASLSQFAFHHLEGDRVAVRIGLTHGCEASRGTLTQLGFLLPIPSALADALAKADRGEEGFLMKDVKRLGRPKYKAAFEGGPLVRKLAEKAARKR